MSSLPILFLNFCMYDIVANLNFLSTTLVKSRTKIAALGVNKLHLVVVRFVHASKPVSVYSNQTLADALHILSKEKIGLAVIDWKTSCLIGSIQCRDLYLLLDDSSLFRNRK